MKQQHIITLFISSLLLFSMSLHAQNDSTEEDLKPKDSLNTKTDKYGIRLGTDLIKLGRTLLDDNYTGFEILADYRLTKKWFVAGELGTEDRNFSTDYIDATTKGSYFKAGFDFNMHDNLFPLDNMIYTGFRVGYSNFSQTINQSTIYTIEQYWQPTTVNTNQREFNGLNAIWAEVLMGLKAEVLNNLYLGVNIQLKYIISKDEPENFANIYIPGVNKIFEGSKIGAGFNYSISYRIPIYKK